MCVRAFFLLRGLSELKCNQDVYVGFESNGETGLFFLSDYTVLNSQIRFLN